MKLPTINFMFSRLTLQLPLLAKATADDESPTPGHMYQEISSILSLINRTTKNKD